MTNDLGVTFSLTFRIILDGEMLVWDPVSERNLPFGTLKTAALGMCTDIRFRALSDK